MQRLRLSTPTDTRYITLALSNAPTILATKVLDINKNRIGTRRNTNAKKELSKDVYEKVCKELEEDIDFYVKMKSKIKDGKFIN